MQKEIMAHFNKDFPFREREKLAMASTSIQNMTRGDRVKLSVDMLDYLRDFQAHVYEGQPIPQVFKSALIEVDGLRDGSVRRFYVTFPENKPEWVYVDVFFNWMHVGKLFYYNVQLPDTSKEENGRYRVYTPAVIPEGVKLSTGILQKLVSEGRDIFTYAYLFVWANKERPELFEEEEIPEQGTTGKKGKKKQRRKEQKKHAANAHNDKPNTRETVHVPRKRRVYNLKPVEYPKQQSHRNTTTSTERLYSVPEWTVKGHVRQYHKKDGTIVTKYIEPQTRRRHKPISNKGGKDYVLHERPLTSQSNT